MITRKKGTRAKENEMNFALLPTMQLNENGSFHVLSNIAQYSLQGESFHCRVLLRYYKILGGTGFCYRLSSLVFLHLPESLKYLEVTKNRKCEPEVKP